MNLAQLQAAVQAEGYPSDTAAVAQQLIALNGQYREICGMERWPFLEKQDATLSTVAATPGYTLPMSDWRSVDAVRIEIAAEYYDLEYREPQDFRDLEHVDRDVAIPQYWTWMNNQLRLYPRPDRVYLVTIDYVMQPPDLASGTDVPVIPLVYHDVLVWGAISSIAYRERDWLGRDFADRKKETLLARMQKEYLVRQRQSASHVKSSGMWNTSRPYPFVRLGG